MGGKSEAAKPTSPSAEETAAQKQQTALLQQEYYRIENLQQALQTSTAQAQKMVGLTSTGYNTDTMVQNALQAGSADAYLQQASQYTRERWQSEQPTAPTFNMEQPEQKYAKLLQNIAAVNNSADKDVRNFFWSQGVIPGGSMAQQKADAQVAYDKGVAEFNNYRTQYLKQMDQYQQEVKNYQNAYNQWKVNESKIGTTVSPTRDNYVAATVADLTKRIQEASGPGLAQEFEARIKSALKAIPEEDAARQGLLNQLVKLTASPEGVQTFSDLFSRVQRGAAGETPIDPATQRELDRQQAVLGNKLRKQLGTGYATSTAGSMALQDYAQARAAAVAKDQREGLQSAIDSLRGYVGSAGDVLTNLGTLQTNQDNRVNNAVNQAGVYNNNRNANLQALISNLQQYEGGEFARKTDIANAWVQSQTAQYSNTGAGQLASQYGQLASSMANQRLQTAQLSTGSSGPGVGASVASGAASGAAAGAAAGPYGALAGAVIGAGLGYASSR